MLFRGLKHLAKFLISVKRLVLLSIRMVAENVVILLN